MNEEDPAHWGLSLQKQTNIRIHNAVQIPKRHFPRYIMQRCCGFLASSMIGVRRVFSRCRCILFRKDLEFAVLLEMYVCTVWLS